MRRGLSAAAAASMTLVLTGCAGEIDDFSSRVMTVNETIARADADNIVRNVIRAGLNEPLTFMAVGQITSTRNSDLKIGLPTITFGPAQMSAQKQFVFNGSIADNSEGYSLQLAELRTDAFTKGMLTPVDPGQLENYAEQGFNREMLFYLFLDHVDVRVTDKINKKAYQYTFYNDPTLDQADCRRVIPADDRNYQNDDVRYYDPIRLTKRYLETKDNPRLCPFRAFQYFVELGTTYGMTIEAGPKDAAATTNYKVDLKLDSGDQAEGQDNKAAQAAGKPAPASQKPAADSKPPPWHTCLNFAFMAARHQGTSNDGACKFTLEGQTLHVEGTSLQEGPDWAVDIGMIFRSPYAMIQYLGRIARLPGAQQPSLMFTRPTAVDADRRLFPIFDHKDRCYLASTYEDFSYCVPRNAYDAKAALNVLVLLVQENTNHSDLPSAAITVQ